jgi:hypothetical protein
MKIPAFIKQLAKVCDTEASRFALGGIKCQSDGKTAQLTATDGRILANVYYPDADATALDVIVEGRLLASAPAAAFKDTRGVTLDGGTLLHGGTRADVTPVEGRFPRYEDIFTIHDDDATDYVPVKLDPAYLKTLCELAHAVGGTTSKGIVLWVKDAQSCVFADARSGEGHVARLAIMPLAADDPKWRLTYPPRPVEKSAETNADSMTREAGSPLAGDRETPTDDTGCTAPAGIGCAVPDVE